MFDKSIKLLVELHDSVCYVWRKKESLHSLSSFFMKSIFIDNSLYNVTLHYSFFNHFFLVVDYSWLNQLLNMTCKMFNIRITDCKHRNVIWVTTCQSVSMISSDDFEIISFKYHIQICSEWLSQDIDQRSCFFMCNIYS